ncbi:XapX domain-containing protein [Natronorubrum bangense]|uniref:XapX domain-containing protein n=2 Tax=Natronorubrum bangense TaxID=61858 RepID=L9WK70_9EURY|nr:DUF1427 family protein [Natronorubrum bangense]ELY49849.1 hypothetical protein C494_07560 [Natronorubrum bangense JCM 10635]QCC55470.1 DUF1427 family protein [Natronorubrum bangense]
MNIIVLSFLAALSVGLLVGVLFTVLDFPIPAPPTFAGVMGVIGTVLGLFLGHQILLRVIG